MTNDITPERAAWLDYDKVVVDAAMKDAEIFELKAKINAIEADLVSIQFDYNIAVLNYLSEREKSAELYEFVRLLNAVMLVEKYADRNEYE